MNKYYVVLRGKVPRIYTEQLPVTLGAYKNPLPVVVHGVNIDEAYEVFKLQPIFRDTAGSLDEPADEVVDQIVKELHTSHIAKMILGNHKVKYIVWCGAKTGIFLSWADCKPNAQNFLNVNHQKVKNLDEAITLYMYKGILPDMRHYTTMEDSVLRSRIVSDDIQGHMKPLASVRADENSMFRFFQGLTMQAQTMHVHTGRCDTTQLQEATWCNDSSDTGHTHTARRAASTSTQQTSEAHISMPAGKLSPVPAHLHM
ncbi:uncharacterized protein LAESUDRAFT_711534 [Laetiporus sulphureus 93-53]|uniref:Ribonuclease H1 N-terminal domain-containing protein n=1 Tax=Laetiporus sulphureus 93-53 TaxID=1314785 RepID=A0A165GGG0_9APHY|nr:uncharacterized protein LAESUDRAFT_711534 [Laetiporus sulphureus 93-53]KZT10312.1 hypothetical protein LAESUDRAFT_711534 [Laetiporus sulphureus 93-53]